jgi:ubiquinone/menaquinone biosynthesis C-methylase UbiE
MTAHKTNKELAFIHELFVAPDWGERFAELIDEQIELPKKGEALYLGSNTGGHAIALQKRAGKNLKFVCVDENEASAEIAREKAKTAASAATDFRVSEFETLPFAGDAYKLVVGDGSLVLSERVPRLLTEMVRVAAPGATVALALPTFSSFGEFFSIYWEALHNCGLMDHEADVESLITVLPAVTAVEEMAEQAGLEEISSMTRIEEFDFASAEKFLAAPLVSDFLMPIWLETLPPDSYQEVFDEIGRLINEESHGVEFALTVKATLVKGKKALGH